MCLNGDERWFVHKERTELRNNSSICRLADPECLDLIKSVQFTSPQKRGEINNLP